MKPYLVKTPKIARWFFPKRVWAFPHQKNAVYLTFDDGPTPEVTPWVLQNLKKANAKATFFCVGENIKKHPEIFKQLVSEGHAFGNHTFNHLNGWKTKTDNYLENCFAFEEIVSHKTINLKSQSSKLFRPPYGKLTSKQAKTLQKKGYKIIMWNVLSADFDTRISKEKCLQNVLQNIQPGSIVVFHDSLKASEKLTYVLPKVLAHIKTKNWDCKTIS